MELIHSNSKINRAGKLIRYYLAGRADPDPAKLQEAVDVVADFRAAHSYPLTKATMGLRSMVTTTGVGPPRVSQRLKRFPTIVDKLTREPTMSLSNMQDIGGCRAVLPSIDAVYAVAHRAQTLRFRHPTQGLRRRHLSSRDYIAEPAPSGYRGIHVILEYDNRRIEVQLRTPSQHEWAVTVERLGGRIGDDLKSGRGPSEVLDLLAAISEAMAIEEVGDVVPASLEAEIAHYRTLAAPHLKGS